MAKKWDVITQTCTICILIAWSVHSPDIRVIASTFVIAVILGLVLRVPRLILLFAIAAPVLPIVVSHFLIEPQLSGKSVAGAPAAATKAWLRVAGMTIFSLTWLKGLTLQKGAQLCRVVGGGQYLLLPFLIAMTFISVTRERWTSIREINALRQTGLLRDRKRIRVRQIPAVGLQLTMASLIASSELALACAGRGIGSQRGLKVDWPVPSLGGLAVLAVTVAISWLMHQQGMI